MTKLISWYNTAAILILVELFLILYLPSSFGVEYTDIQNLIYSIIVLFGILGIYNKVKKESLLLTGILTSIASIVYLVLGRTIESSITLEISVGWIISYGFVYVWSRINNKRYMKAGHIQNRVVMWIRTVDQVIERKLINWYNKIVHGKSLNIRFKQKNTIDTVKEMFAERHNLEKSGDRFSWFKLISIALIVTVLELLLTQYTTTSLNIETGPLTLGIWGGIVLIAIIGAIKRIDLRTMVTIGLINLAFAPVFLSIEQVILAEQLVTYAYFWILTWFVIQIVDSWITQDMEPGQINHD